MHWKRIGIGLHVMKVKETVHSFHCEKLSLIKKKVDGVGGRGRGWGEGGGKWLP